MTVVLTDEERAVLRGEPGGELRGAAGLIERLTRPLCPRALRDTGEITAVEMAALRDWLVTRDDPALRAAGRLIDRYLWRLAAAWIESEGRMKA